MEINKMKMSFKSRTDFCRNKKGNLIGNKKVIKTEANNISKNY